MGIPGKGEHLWRVSNAIAGVLAVMIMIGAGCFVYLNGHVVLNRYSDATWHLSVADEFATSGVFGKDPFIPDAPRFSQFGLWDWLNGMFVRWFRIPVDEVLVLTNAVFSVVFLSACFCAGKIMSRSSVGGLMAMGFVLVSALQGSMRIITAGWPFGLALSLYFLLLPLYGRLIAGVLNTGACVGCCANAKSGRDVIAKTGFGFALGSLVGIIFALHAFVGIFAVVIMLIVAVLAGLVAVRGWRAWRVLSITGVAAALGFFCIASPWLWMHLELRPVLRVLNAHVYRAKSPPVNTLVLIGSAALMVLTVMGWRSKSPKIRVLSLEILVAGALSVLAAVPFLNHLLETRISGYMAERVLLFFPSGLVMVSLLPVSGDVRMPPLFRRVSIALLVVYTAVSVALVLEEVKSMVYAWNTREYDSHEYAGLMALQPMNLLRKTVLSDPYTSYYARRFVGSYAVTVPSGHASPAVDYVSRDAVWNTVIHNPDALSQKEYQFDYVLINKRTDRPRGAINADILSRALSWWMAHYAPVYDDVDYVLFRMVP